MGELWLELNLVGTNKYWKKYFKDDYTMDEFIRKCKYTNTIAIIDDSRNYLYNDYNLNNN